jgi:hypothetical protein
MLISTRWLAPIVPAAGEHEIEHPADNRECQVQRIEHVASPPARP